MKNFKMPAIIYLDGVFYIIDKNTIIPYTIEQGILYVPENRVRKQKSGWILDREGNFYTLEAIGKDNEWARKIPLITFFFSFIKSKYKISGPKKITVSEMLKKMHEMPKNTPYKDLREDFIRHLNTYDKKMVITKKVLDEWPIE